MASGIVEHITSQDVEMGIPDSENKPGDTESIEEEIAFCRWEDDGGAVPQRKLEL
jgi:hypothetical protein